MPIVNQTVDRALHRLGYSPEQVADIEAHVHERGTVLGAPPSRPGPSAGIRLLHGRQRDLPKRPRGR